MKYSNNPLEQGGGEVPLRLSEIDPSLARAGKSIEDISDPKIRVGILWTTIGQYRASADMTRREIGAEDASPTIQDAQGMQLVSAWSRETRRVYPLIRKDSASAAGHLSIREALDADQFVQAYSDLVEMRGDTPDFMHPDVRFELFSELYQKVPEEPDSLLRRLLKGEMIDETVKGGPGMCDNTERLRRYERIATITGSDRIKSALNRYIYLLDVSHPVPDNNSGYFDHEEPTDLATTLELIQARYCRPLAQYMLDVRGFDDETTDTLQAAA